MPIKIQEANFRELQISDRTADANVINQHKDSLTIFRKSLTEGIQIACLPSFRRHSGSETEFIADTARFIKIAFEMNSIFDFGIVDNKQITRWERQIEKSPINTLPWSGPALFLMSHPDQIQSDHSISTYLVTQLSESQVEITELLFISASKKFLIYQSLVAVMPMGKSREVILTAWSDFEPTGETVNSTLPPAFMGTAFLAANIAQKPS